MDISWSWHGVWCGILAGFLVFGFTYLRSRVLSYERRETAHLRDLICRSRKVDFGLFQQWKKKDSRNRRPFRFLRLFFVSTFSELVLSGVGFFSGLFGGSIDSFLDPLVPFYRLLIVINGIFLTLCFGFLVYWAGFVDTYVSDPDGRLVHSSSRRRLK